MTIETTHSYEAVDVGALRVGIWTPLGTGSGDPQTILALHGITATHLAWRFLPAALPDVRVVAPDLRGRGRSNELPGPYGMPRHADDFAEVLDELGTGPVVVVGHSMGGFAAVVLAHRHPQLVRSLVLVDGGLPLDLPAGLDPDVIMKAVLGPAAERLAMTFADAAAYRDFWRAHPAFAGRWSEELGEYFDYDLEASDGGFRSSSLLAAVTDDQRELVSGESLLPALLAFGKPAVFLRAERGMLDGDPLYAADYVATWVDHLPSLTSADVPDVNHYTIVMSPAGASVIADTIRTAHDQGATAST